LISMIWDASLHEFHCSILQHTGFHYLGINAVFYRPSRCRPSNIRLQNILSSTPLRLLLCNFGKHDLRRKNIVFQKNAQPSQLLATSYDTLSYSICQTFEPSTLSQYGVHATPKNPYGSSKESSSCGSHQV
jgi:hypothetical protein